MPPEQENPNKNTSEGVASYDWWRAFWVGWFNSLSAVVVTPASSPFVRVGNAISAGVGSGHSPYRAARGVFRNGPRDFFRESSVGLGPNIKTSMTREFPRGALLSLYPTVMHRKHANISNPYADLAELTVAGFALGFTDAMLIHLVALYSGATKPPIEKIGLLDSATHYSRGLGALTGRQGILFSSFLIAQAIIKNSSSATGDVKIAVGGAAFALLAGAPFHHSYVSMLKAGNGNTFSHMRELFESTRKGAINGDQNYQRVVVITQNHEELYGSKNPQVIKDMSEIRRLAESLSATAPRVAASNLRVAIWMAMARLIPVSLGFAGTILADNAADAVTKSDLWLSVRSLGPAAFLKTAGYLHIPVDHDTVVYPESAPTPTLPPIPMPSLDSFLPRGLPGSRVLRDAGFYERRFVDPRTVFAPAKANVGGALRAESSRVSRSAMASSSQTTPTAPVTSFAEMVGLQDAELKELSRYCSC